MKNINIYLNFKGQTEAAFNFYKSVFGGEFQMLQRFKDTPETAQVAESEKDLIMHIALPIGNLLLMGTDVIESRGQKLVQGNNFSISIEAESDAEADKLFAQLSVEGKVDMALERTFWNAYFGMLTDKFGIQWMINHSYQNS